MGLSERFPIAVTCTFSPALISGAFLWACGLAPSYGYTTTAERNSIAASL